jgi:hypothetical protein
MRYCEGREFTGDDLAGEHAGQRVFAGHDVAEAVYRQRSCECAVVSCLENNGLSLQMRPLAILA